jgi:hypothetical protein
MFLDFKVVWVVLDTWEKGDSSCHLKTGQIHNLWSFPVILPLYHAC